MIKIAKIISMAKQITIYIHITIRFELNNILVCYKNYFLPQSINAHSAIIASIKYLISAWPQCVNLAFKMILQEVASKDILMTLWLIGMFVFL